MPITVPTPFLYNARVVEVHDGDTVIVDWDWGFRRWDHDIPIRVRGIACNELDEPGGPDTRDYVAGLVVPGQPLVLATAKPDKYAPRVLADVYYQAPDAATIARSPDSWAVNLAVHLVVTGWAIPWNGRGLQPKLPWPREIREAV